MTTDTHVLQGTLSRRIAHGTATVGDLALLGQLLRCERRRYLGLGALSGAALAVGVLVLALTL